MASINPCPDITEVWKGNTVKIILSIIRWLKSPSKYEFDDEFEYLIGKKAEKAQMTVGDTEPHNQDIYPREKLISRLAL